MKRSMRPVVLGVLGCAVVAALFGAACGSDVVETPQSEHVDVHPPAGSTLNEQTADTGWKAYAIGKGPDEGAELHLEKTGKHVLLPDAAPLGFSPDGKFLLLVWEGGLAAIAVDETDIPRPLTDASKISTPGRAADIRWSGHRLEYDLPGEDDRKTVMVDLDSGAVTTRPMD